MEGKSRCLVLMLSALSFVATGWSRALALSPVVGEVPALAKRFPDSPHCRFTRSVRAPDGTIYLLGSLESRDGGRSLEPVDTAEELQSAMLLSFGLSLVFGAWYLFEILCLGFGIYPGFTLGFPRPTRK